VTNDSVGDQPPDAASAPVEEPLPEDIAQALADAVLEASVRGKDLTLTVRPEAIVDVCRYLRAQPTQPDVVYMNAWPLFSEAFVARDCQARTVPLLMQVMDVYPESLLEKLPSSLRWAYQGPHLHIDRWIVSPSAREVV